MTIHIENSGAGIYQVTVEGASTTVHSVTVTPEYLQKLTGGHVSAEWGVSENNRRARYYALTPTGRRQLQAEESAWRRYAAAVFKVLEPA